MPYDRFLIAPFQSGQQTNVRPWIIMDDAFELLLNAYTYRGRIKKRVGSRPMNETVADELQQFNTRLRVDIGTTDAGGNFAGIVPGTIFKIGQAFSVGDDMFTVNALGSPVAMLSTNGAAAGTYDTATGAVTIADPFFPLADVFFYPAEPVMGLITYNQNFVNDELLIAFDTQFSYVFVAGGWQRIVAVITPGSATWTGNNAQFFWGSNYRGASTSDLLLFVTNANIADNIRFVNSTGQWDTLIPVINAAGDTVRTCLLIVSFKDRLLLLNTVERIVGVDTFFLQRCRFSQNGSPFDVDAWRQDIPGKGGFLDAPTTEAIVSCEFLKDRLIVYFERSTWELVYTGNEILPFRWQKINTERGVESTHSIIPFDKVVMGFGSTGIHACNGINVERIDEKIPFTIFDVHNINFGPQRVAGIRDYFNEQLYWSYSSSAEVDGNNDTFPNRILQYDYLNGSWAISDDSITAFGYFQLQNDIVWQAVSEQWQNYEDAWADPSIQQLFRTVVAGNQEGYTFLMDQGITRNSIALQITDIAAPGTGVVTLGAIDHNLPNNSYIFIDFITGTGTLPNLNGNIFQVKTLTKDIFTIDANVAGNYTGGGIIRLVSQIFIKTKQYNFYNKAGYNLYIPEVDFLVDRTANGQITIDYVVSSSVLPLQAEAAATGTLIGTGILETTPLALKPLEVTQQRFWHVQYLQADGENIQVLMYLSPGQLLDVNIAWSDFQLHAFMFHAKITSTFAGV